MTEPKNRNLQVDEINRRIRTDPRALIEEENRHYYTQLYRIAQQIEDHMRRRLLILLSGPSSSGKTTTAQLLCQRLAQDGLTVQVVSLDDFYRGRNIAPRLPDGTLDYETVEALDLPLLHRCMRRLLRDGVADLPVFDFHAGVRLPETREMRVPEGSAVIFEGIHALNSRLEKGFGSLSVLKLFVNVETPIWQGTQQAIGRREMRLCRRILRDARFRNSQIDNTLHMWPQVVRGEKLYLQPYMDTADLTLDTTFAFEPCMTAPLILPQLEQVRAQFPEWSERLLCALAPFEALPADFLPEDSLLHEFFG